MRDFPSTVIIIHASLYNDVLSASREINNQAKEPVVGVGVEDRNLSFIKVRIIYKDLNFFWILAATFGTLIKGKAVEVLGKVLF